MPREETAKHYRERINTVLHYIQTHLDEELDLNKLAELSAISPFHFHRIMRAYLNESLMSYIIRVRLETQ
ncbi:MAG: AraC family transcriptional regulator [Bacteroidales bacterium]